MLVALWALAAIDPVSTKTIAEIPLDRLYLAVRAQHNEPAAVWVLRPEEHSGGSVPSSRE